MNSKTRFPSKSSTPQLGVFDVRMLGTGAAAPTKVGGDGDGITITRVNTGRYLLTWSEMPGTYKGFDWGMDAATPGDIAGHTVIALTPAAGASAVEFDLYNASFALHDLAANEYINLSIKFAS